MPTECSAASFGFEIVEGGAVLTVLAGKLEAQRVACVPLDRLEHAPVGTDRSARDNEKAPGAGASGAREAQASVSPVGSTGLEKERR